MRCGRDTRSYQRAVRDSTSRDASASGDPGARALRVHLGVAHLRRGPLQHRPPVAGPQHLLGDAPHLPEALVPQRHAPLRSATTMPSAVDSRAAASSEADCASASRRAALRGVLRVDQDDGPAPLHRPQRLVHPQHAPSARIRRSSRRTSVPGAPRLVQAAHGGAVFGVVQAASGALQLSRHAQRARGRGLATPPRPPARRPSALPGRRANHGPKVQGIGQGSDGKAHGVLVWRALLIGAAFAAAPRDQRKGPRCTAGVGAAGEVARTARWA